MSGMEYDTEGGRDGVWAQPYTLNSGQTQFHQLGHVRLWVTLLDLEWQIRHETLEQDGGSTNWLEAIGHHRRPCPCNGSFVSQGPQR